MKKLTILIVLLIAVLSITQGQPTAIFEMVEGIECDSTNISFIDQSTSTENIVSWLWDFGDGSTSTVQNPEHAYAEAGTYTICLDVTDALNQMDQTCEPLIISDSLSINNAVITNLSCFGDNSGAIDITVFGGVAPYTFLWANGAATEDITGLSSGDYHITVTDDNGCSFTGIYTVAQPNLLLLDLFATCATNGENNGTVTATVSGGVAPYAYEWTNGITAPTNENLFAGVFGITVTDANGCTVSEEIDLSEGTIEAEIQGPFDYCLHDAISAVCAEVTNAEPGDIYSYLWTGPLGFVSTEQCLSFDSLYASMEGVYSVVITDDNGCDYLLSQEISITTVEDIIVSAGAEVPIVCEDEVVQLEVVTLGDPGDYTYEWSPSALLNDPTIANPEATIVATTWFEVVVTDLNGCSVNSNGIQVTLDLDCMWPGDTDTNKVVNNLDLLNIGLVFDSLSPERPNASLDWVAQANYNWGGNVGGTNVNRKHVDCDGDGFITNDDTLAITLNWGEMHEFTGADDVQFSNPDNPQDGITLMAPFYVQPDTLIENESYALPIILGEEGSEAENVYGIGFTLEYDSSIIVVGSASVGYDGWLGTVNEDLLAIQKTFVSPGRIDIGMTRVDKISMNGFGQIGVLYITIEDDVLLRADNDSRENGLEVAFNITNVRIIDSNGQEVPIVPMETTTIVESPVRTNDINWDEYIQLAPNPVDDVLYLTTKNIEIETLKLFSISGELLMESTARNLINEINTSHLNPGMYLLKVRTDLGVMVKRVAVMR